MHKSHHRFSSQKDADFFKVLRNRVNEYFRENSISRQGNAGLVVKSIVMVLLFLVPYFVLIFSNISSPLIVLGLWGIMGLGMTGIGLNIMHDANHGSFSKKQKWNKLMAYSLEVLGGSSYIWRLQHNVMHHTYTNVHGADHDIEGPDFLRFSPDQEMKKVHRFQFLYAWFFYGFMSLSFISTKDFKFMYAFRDLGLIKSKEEFRKEFRKLVISKVIYYLIIMVIPMLLVPVSPWIIVVGFLTMHYISGFILSIIFQTAHVMPDCEFPQPTDDGLIDNNWAVHQMLTTTNFAPKNRVFSWLVGGLNFQVEHHLFANISHIHYRKISKIVSETAKEYGIPYNTEPTFLSAIRKHAKMLYQLGRGDLKPIPIKNR